jgi:hypothetical protein
MGQRVAVVAGLHALVDHAIAAQRIVDSVVVVVVVVVVVIPAIAVAGILRVLGTIAIAQMARLVVHGCIVALHMARDPGGVLGGAGTAANLKKPRERYDE